MIKINLATKKKAAAVEGREPTSGGGFSGAQLKNLRVDDLLELLKEPTVRKLLLFLIATVSVYYTVDQLKDSEVAQVNNSITKKTAERDKYKTDLNQRASYTALKKQLEEDRKLIETKLVIIQKLIADRNKAPDFLLKVSQEIPKEVWLSELNFSKDMLKIKGSARGFDQVSDFMKNLGDNPYLQDLKLGDSQRSKEAGAGNLTTFSLEAKRRPE
jgi:Tfp pilus assembly protein PilN